jgi:branched-chain amino acid transport system ATP-binding protein
MSTQVPRLTVKNLSLSFGGLRVLQNISMSLSCGEVLGLIGPNGAGKSALLNCISGLYSPEPRSVITFGDSTLNCRARSRAASVGITRTFQHIHLLEGLNVVDNVLLGLASQFKGGVLRRYMIPFGSMTEEKEMRQRSLAALAMCGIEHIAYEPVAGLPLGIRRRVDLARALVSRPKLLLLDEPASGLSSDERLLVRDLVEIAQRTAGVAVMWIEHDLELVISAATRILVLHHGQIIAEGSPRESDDARSRLIRAYLTGNASELPLREEVNSVAGSR